MAGDAIFALDVCPCINTSVGRRFRCRSKRKASPRLGAEISPFCNLLLLSKARYVNKGNVFSPMQTRGVKITIDVYASRHRSKCMFRQAILCPYSN